MEDVTPRNRPPAFDLTTVEPSAPVVRVNMACRPQDHRYEPVAFYADVIELDEEQELWARWFWNYDASVNDPGVSRPVREDRLRPVLGVRRGLEPFHLPPEGFDTIIDNTPLGTNTLEVFVVERSALVDEAGDLPLFRNLWECDTDPAAPPDCVHSHPALMRWTVVTYSDAADCPLPEEP